MCAGTVAAAGIRLRGAGIRQPFRAIPPRPVGLIWASERARSRVGNPGSDAERLLVRPNCVHEKLKGLAACN
jgi:hypothetical protein